MKKINFVPTTVVLAAALLITGCATNQANQNAGIGAALGCVGGAAIAAMTGGKPAQGCLMGAAAGAAIGFFEGRKKDLELAEQTRKSILESTKGTDTQVVVTKRSDKVPESERAQAQGAQTVEAVDKMVVQVPNTLIAKQDDRAVQTFGRVGGYVSSANVPATVVVNARNEQDYNYIVQNIRKGYGPTNPEPTKVKYVFAELKRGSQASVEVVHAQA